MRNPDRPVVHRLRLRSAVWCWIALWATVLALAFAVYALSQRVDQFDKKQPIIYNWGVPEEGRDVRHDLDKSDER